MLIGLLVFYYLVTGLAAVIRYTDNRDAPGFRIIFFLIGFIAIPAGILKRLT